MTKLYCPKGHEIANNGVTITAYRMRNPILWCSTCENTDMKKKGRFYFEMDCVTEEQLNKDTMFWCACGKWIYGYQEQHKCKQKQESETQNSNSVEIDINKAEEPWINFAERKPEVGQKIEVIQLITDKEFEGVYDSPFSSAPAFAGYIQTINGCMRAFKEWRPAQPEMQERSDVNVKELGSNTQEFEKKDCVFDSEKPIVGKTYCQKCKRNFHAGKEKLKMCNECVGYDQSETVRENRTVDMHTKTQDPIHIENDTQEFEKKDCVFDSIIGKYITNIDGHEYCIEHKQYHSCTVRENRTVECNHQYEDCTDFGPRYCKKCLSINPDDIDQNSTIEENSLVKKQPEQPEEQECEHSWLLMMANGNTSANAYAKCTKCKETVDTDFEPASNRQSQIAIDKVIEACVRAQKELADVGLMDRGLRAFQNNLMEMMEEELNHGYF